MKSELYNGRCGILICLIFVFCFLSGNSFGAELAEIGIDAFKHCGNDYCEASLQDVSEHFEFYGLASYYNNISAYLVNQHSITDVEVGSRTTLKQGQWFVIAGRLDVLLVRASGLQLEFSDTQLLLENSSKLQQPDSVVKVVRKSDLSGIASELDQVRYVHLWGPLAWLAKLVESSIVALKANVIFHWGMAIVLFSILVKLLLLPVIVMTARMQRKVSQIQAKLTPKLAEIKANYDGEEAHNRLMAAHKELGVSPFYTLKPMLGTFIQIPILIAVFNALGEMPQLDGQSFLWIDNLAYPDAIGYLPGSVPMIGNTVSLLPFIMTAVTIVSVIFFQNRHASKPEIKRQKRNLFLMAVAFFVLFYAFPAAMVLYWTLVNLLHIIQQQLIKI